MSIEDFPIEQTKLGEEKNELTPESSNEEGWEVLEEELDKVRLLLKHWEAVNISITPKRKRRRFCKSHQKLRKLVLWKKREKDQDNQKGELEPISDPPNLEGRSKYLYYVGAKDCINMEQQWKQGFQQIKPEPHTQPKKPKRKGALGSRNKETLRQ